MTNPLKIPCGKNLSSWSCGEGNCEEESLCESCQRVKDVLDDLREKVLAWANKWGYKGISRECEKELEELLTSQGGNDEN